MCITRCHQHRRDVQLSPPKLGAHRALYAGSCTFSRRRIPEASSIHPLDEEVEDPILLFAIQHFRRSLHRSLVRGRGSRASLSSRRRAIIAPYLRPLAHAFNLPLNILKKPRRASDISLTSSVPFVYDPSLEVSESRSVIILRAFSRANRMGFILSKFRIFNSRYIMLINIYI